jgi:hypothetical protein
MKKVFGELKWALWLWRITLGWGKAESGAKLESEATLWRLRLPVRRKYWWNCVQSGIRTVNVKRGLSWHGEAVVWKKIGKIWVSLAVAPLLGLFVAQNLGCEAKSSPERSVASPCESQGQTYPDGASWEVDCNTCTCTDGAVECTTRDCSAPQDMGTPHFDMTTDSRLPVDLGMSEDMAAMLDLAPPSVSVTAPTTGEFVRSPFVVSATADAATQVVVRLERAGEEVAVRSATSDDAGAVEIEIDWRDFLPGTALDLHVVATNQFATSEPRSLRLVQDDSTTCWATGDWGTALAVRPDQASRGNPCVHGWPESEVGTNAAYAYIGTSMIADAPHPDVRLSRDDCWLGGAMDVARSHENYRTYVTGLRAAATFGPNPFRVLWFSRYDILALHSLSALIESREPTLTFDWFLRPNTTVSPDPYADLVAFFREDTGARCTEHDCDWYESWDAEPCGAQDQNCWPHLLSQIPGASARAYEEVVYYLTRIYGAGRVRERSLALLMDLTRPDYRAARVKEAQALIAATGIDGVTLNQKFGQYLSSKYWKGWGVIPGQSADRGGYPLSWFACSGYDNSVGQQDLIPLSDPSCSVDHLSTYGAETPWSSPPEGCPGEGCSYDYADYVHGWAKLGEDFGAAGVDFALSIPSRLWNRVPSGSNVSGYAMYDDPNTADSMCVGLRSPFECCVDAGIGQCNETQRIIDTAHRARWVFLDLGTPSFRNPDVHREAIRDLVLAGVEAVITIDGLLSRDPDACDGT